jgi:hypothetical protein
MTRSMTMVTLALALLVVGGASAQQSGSTTPDRTNPVAQMNEDQIKQKLQGEGFSQISDVKKVEVKKYRWTAKAMRSGQPQTIEIDELGRVSAK